jgi:Ca2+-binding RTX toxin-like protein
MFNAGGLGTVFAPTTRNNNFTITSLGLGTLNTATLTSFTGVSGLEGGIYADNFNFENGGRITGVINGGNGTDNLSLANYSSSSILRTNITGSDIGTIDLMQPGNLVGNVSVVGSYSKIENLTGGAGTDIFHFNNAGSVSVSLDGGLGNNTLDYRDYSIAGLNVNLETKTATLVGGGASNRINRIRDIFGTINRDNLVGDSQPNIIYGGAANDNIVGGGGNDLIIGGTGDDNVSGGTGYNVVIGGYVDFNLGGGGSSNTSYGISVSNWDYVLRSMMDQLSGVVDGTTADSTYALMENTGVSVSIPGVSGSKNVQLIASTTGNTTLRGTVFDDGNNDRLTIGGNNQGWLFYSTSDIKTDLTKARRKTVANRRTP